jgi:predicted Zn-ribbon and HTH transcriptional regulator
MMLIQDPNDRIDSVEKIQFEIESRIKVHNENKKIQQLKLIKISEEEEKDELIVEPPRLVDFSYDDSSNTLTLKLSKCVNHNWINCMTNSSYNSLMGYGPERFNFSGNKVTVGLRNINDIDAIQIIIDYFKSWVENANSYYPQLVKNERDRRRREESTKLAQEIERKSKVLKALEKIKI